MSGFLSIRSSIQCSAVEIGAHTVSVWTVNLKGGSRTLQRFQGNGCRKRIKGEINCGNGTERIQQKIHFEPKVNRRPRDIYICKFHCQFTAQIIEEELKSTLYQYSCSIICYLECHSNKHGRHVVFQEFRVLS